MEKSFFSQKPFCFLKQKHYCWKHCLLYFALTFFLSLEVGKSFFFTFYFCFTTFVVKSNGGTTLQKTLSFYFSVEILFSASLLDPKRKSEFLVGDVSVSEVFGSLNRFDRGRNRKKKKNCFSEGVWIPGKCADRGVADERTKKDSRGKKSAKPKRWSEKNVEEFRRSPFVNISNHVDLRSSQLCLIFVNNIFLQ